MYFEPQFIRTDVTAIKVFNNVTFVGIGATLHIFCNNTRELITKINVKDTRGEPIFGIIPFAVDKIILYGGNFLLLFDAHESYHCVEEVCRAILPDWILEAKLINNETKIATVSMQNKLQIWDSNLKLLEIFECSEQCILYSAHICYDNYKELLVLSGTVFNEVLIWTLSKDDSNYSPVIKRLQKHQGVIFSIQYSQKDALICSTSDDRSAILWKVNSGDLQTEIQLQSVNIIPICQVYGHLSRIFKCLILNDVFITAGEDSIVNIWTLQGELKRKVETNQGSPIWAVDYDKSQEVLVTGGGSGGVYKFSLTSEIIEEKIDLPNKEKPKIISILASDNTLVFTESGVLFLNKNGKWNRIRYFEDLKSYVVLKVSKCRNLLALAGFTGQLYLYRESEEHLQNISNFQSNNHIRIMAFHWLQCDTMLICQEAGKLTLLQLKKSGIKPISSFLLPPSSQRCTNAAVIFDKNIIVGDRKGNIFVYSLSQMSPIQTLSRAHSHLGVSNLTVKKNNLISLGRNSIIKTFTKSQNKLILVSADKVPYSWLLDVIDNLVIAFSANNIVIWDYKAKRILLEKYCGGGHRSWDIFKNENRITFVYVKDTYVNTLIYDLNLNRSYDLIDTFHLKEVNCMNIIKVSHQYILVSGGEDTTLKITLTNPSLRSFQNLITLKSHLSSIRCITIYDLGYNRDRKQYLIITAGGRAQIICWTLEFCVKSSIEDLVCQENHSYYEPLDLEESETRIMDLCVIELQEQLFLFAACSDGHIKMFSLEQNDGFKLVLQVNIFYKLKCIFKVFSIGVFDKNVLMTLASDGDIAFWDIQDILFNKNVNPFGKISVHQSGINTYSKFQVNDSSFIFLTAGDDNIVALNYLKFQIENQTLRVQLIDTFFEKGTHWAQITGSYINNNYILTVSVDQRVILYKWRLNNEHIECKFISKYNSAIPDIKGLICIDATDFDIFVFGLGVEFLKLK